jgi:hypothetical protein
MRKTFFSCQLVLSSALALGFAGSASAQGFINFCTYYNTSTSPTAIANGQWWLGGTYNWPWAPPTPTLLDQDVNAELWGCATPTGPFTLLADLLLSNGSAQGDITLNAPGRFWDNSNYGTYQVPGATTVAFFYIQAWTGNANNLSQAEASGARFYNGYWGGIFENPLGPTAASAPNLTMNPAIVLGVVPEPGALILAGLGAAALLLSRRSR